MLLSQETIVPSDYSQGQETERGCRPLEIGVGGHRGHDSRCWAHCQPRLIHTFIVPPTPDIHSVYAGLWWKCLAKHAWFCQGIQWWFLTKSMLHYMLGKCRQVVIGAFKAWHIMVKHNFMDIRQCTSILFSENTIVGPFTRCVPLKRKTSDRSSDGSLAWKFKIYCMDVIFMNLWSLWIERVAL